MITQSLNGDWKFRQIPGGRWQAAEVPGSVHLDLLRLGQIPDPFFADQEKQVKWVAETDWEYARDFEAAPELLRAERVFLCADGLDTLAEITLNGQAVGITDNMFRSYRWEVKDGLIPGGNQLRITFRSPVRYITAKYKGQPLTCGMESIPGGTYLRKAACHFGWDWGPKLPPMGIWKDIQLMGAATARLSDVHVRQEHSGGGVQIEAALAVERWRSAGLSARMVVTAPDGSSLTTASNFTGDEVRLAVIIRHPQLWWPNGYGDQPLYRVQIQLVEENMLLDEREMTIGLRTLELRQAPDEWGESFTFIVNGTPIFAKGANWIPADTFPNRITGASLDRLVSSAAAVHMNMLRVWGGGYYETEHFYDLCDRYGILVWQDFMFACGIYPLGNPAFRENLAAETRETVRRLRHRACLALWCGNNEMETGWVEWGWSRPANRRLKAEYSQYFYHDLPELVSAEDPDHAYWPSSPSSGQAFQAPDSQDRGDAHYWDVWHGRKPFSAYSQQYPRFMSEFGFQSLPPLRTIKSFAEPSDWNLTSYVMEHHQRSGVGNELILSQMAAHFRIPKDFASLVYVSMILQAEGIRYGVEHWRRSKQRVSGTLYWQLDDNWPVISWSSIDYYGRWKALHYAARHFYAPALLSVERDAERLALYVTSDLREDCAGVLSWSLQTLDGKIIQSGDSQVSIPALQSQRVAELDFSTVMRELDPFRMFFYAELALPGQPTSRQFIAFVPDKHLALEDPGLEARLEADGARIIIRVTARSLARFVELQFARVDTVFSDNYFTLPAGATREVSCLLPEGWTLEQVRAELELRSLFDSY
jgi:beta-mannosidase